MTQTEALRLALEALEDLGNHHHDCPQWPTYTEPEKYPKCTCGYDQAITAIKAALEAKDEPVATDWERIARVQNAKLMAVCDEASGFEKLCEVMDKYEALSPTPPQRKPLTDEEIEKMRHLIDWTAHWSYGTFARAIEAAHGIKDNT